MECLSQSPLSEYSSVWLQDEAQEQPEVWPSLTSVPSIWEVVNGTAIQLGDTRLIIVPSDTIDIKELRVPAEWVDIAGIAGNYYLAVQVNLADCWLRVWGYATHQQLKHSGTYDSLTRTYSLEGEDLIEDINVMWVARELCLNETAEVETLPTLSSAQAETLLAQLSQPTPYSPRLDVEFKQWAALLENPTWRQQLYSKRLLSLATEFRCATWLPVIYQNPAAVPLSWEELRRGDGSDSKSPQPKPNKLRLALIASVACALLVVGVRQVGLLETPELQAFDRLIQQRPDEKVDPRLLVVAVTEDDFKYQNQLGMERQGSLSDAALSQLLKKLEPLQPRAISLFIYRDFPVKPSQAELATQLKHPNFFASCKSSDTTTNNPGVSPPPEVPQDQLGFTDIITDSDNVLRRHLWYATFNNNSPCKTEASFSIQLALHYLYTENIEVETTPEGYLRVGKVLLKSLESRAGGYQSLDDNGYQMLLNYRSRRIAEQVTLKQILKGEFNPALIKDRIVIIGTTAPSYKDNIYTPYSVNQQPDQTMRGVFVQAQMVSQIISAVKDNRPLLGVWVWWGDALWIWGWALTGGLLACYIRRKVYLGLAAGVAGATLYGFCFILLIQGTWVPLIPSALALIVSGGLV